MISKFAFTVAHVLSAVFLLLAAKHIGATEIVYTPINPSFGGNPLNSVGLMSIAQAQNPFTAPVLSPIESFNLSLQRSILSRLTSQTLNTMFGSNTKLVEGSYDTAGYTVQVADNGTGGLTITTTDKTTGAVASFQIASGGL
jgi:curli production assembly/transport component CsgF